MREPTVYTLPFDNAISEHSRIASDAFNYHMSWYVDRICRCDEKVWHVIQSCKEISVYFRSALTLFCDLEYITFDLDYGGKRSRESIQAFDGEKRRSNDDMLRALNEILLERVIKNHPEITLGDIMDLGGEEL